METWWTLARRTDEPPMTRFLALELARSHSYDLRPAERDFGYRERVSTKQATEALSSEPEPSFNDSSNR
jgi:hypothetical protein